MIIVFSKWAILGIFFFIFVFSIEQLVDKLVDKILPMTGFEPWISGVRSDHCTNRATTNAHLWLLFTSWVTNPIFSLAFLPPNPLDMCNLLYVWHVLAHFAWYIVQLVLKVLRYPGDWTIIPNSLFFMENKLIWEEIYRSIFSLTVLP